MAIQMTAKERLQAKAQANKQLEDQAREQELLRAQEQEQPSVNFMERLREEERQRQEIAAKERRNQMLIEAGTRNRAERSGAVDVNQVNRTPMQDRAKAARANSQYQLGDVRTNQGRVGAAAQSIGLNTAASVQYLSETAKQANKNTREYMQTLEAEEYAQAVSDFNRVRQNYWEGTPEYQAAFDRVQEARKALEETSREVRSQTVDKNSKGSQMMAESQALREKALEGTEGLGRIAGETAISVASTLSKLPLGVAAPVAMGAEAAAGKAYELQQKGVGAGQALTRGLISGAIESATEKVPLDRLADLVKAGGKSVLRNVLQQAGVEATEESLSYLANWIADAAAKDPNAEFSLQELGESALGGGLSGLVFGLGGTGANRAIDPMTQVIQQTGKAKEAPTGTSLHLADGQVQGLPMVEKTAETVESLPMVEKEKTAGQSQTVENKTKGAAKTAKPEDMTTGKSEYKPQPFAEAYPVPNAEASGGTSETMPEFAPNSNIEKSEQVVKPQGLPMVRQESLRNAYEASLNGGKTLGDNERRTGAPIPSEVESQLQAIEMLSTPMDEDVHDVANTIRKYMGPEAADYWLKNGQKEEPETFLNDRPTPENSGAVTDAEGNVVGTKATDKLGIRIEGSIANMGKVQGAREAQWSLDETNRQIDKLERELHASPAEKRMAENVAKDIDTLDNYVYGWDGKNNRRRSVVEELAAMYRLRDTYDKHAVKALGKQNKDAFIDTLNNEILNHVEEATPPGQVSLHTNTWDRNNLRTWGREVGEKVNRLIFDPIKENEANRIRWLDKQVTDLEILGKLTDEENKAVFDMLDNGKQTADCDGVRNEVVQEAADKLRQKYSDYYDAINDVLVAHGYPEIGFIKNYAPHTNEESVRKAMSIFEKLGISDQVSELPTEIAGRTDTFKPGKKWDPHFLHRTGDKSALDAVGGFLSYVNYMSEVLHHVDDIQKVRTFGDQIRYMYGDEGLKADYDAVRADTTMNEAQKERELERIRSRQTDNSKMGAYVTSLDNYANILAGKQTQLDRAVESAIGRRGLNTIQKPIQMLVRSSVPGNLSSAINQTVQLPWLMAEAGEGNVLQAAFDLTRGKLRKEDFGAQSTFVTGKRGAEAASKMNEKTAGEKIVNAASLPFEVVDDAVSQVAVRAFYLKNIKAGMDHKSAMRQADRDTEKLFGSRMKGTKANVFSDKSLKWLTTFQLEIANQWEHLKFDLPQEFRDIEKSKGKPAAVAEAAKRIAKGAVYTYALNELIQMVTGNKPAGYDIIGAIADYIEAGRPDEEDEEQKFDYTAGLGELGKSIADDIPYLSTIGAVLGVGDGRLPLPSVDTETIFGGVKKRWNAETDEEKAAGKRQIAEGVLKSAATMMPMGNQIKKTIQGGTDVFRGGRYSADGTRLLYEVEKNPQNIARGLLFGRNALPEAREYWDNGGKAVLSEKQTEKMKEAEAYGVGQDVYLDYVTQAKKLTSDKDEEGETIEGSLTRKKIDLLDGMDITDDQKLQLYLNNVATDKQKEYAEALQDEGLSWSQMVPALSSYETDIQRLEAVVNDKDLTEEDKQTVIRATLDGEQEAAFLRCTSMGLDSAVYVKARAFYSTAYADKDENGKSIRDSKKNKVWNCINRLTATQRQKDALSEACGYKSKLEEAPWNNQAVGLPMLEVPENGGSILTLPTAKDKQSILMLP